MRLTPKVLLTILAAIGSVAAQSDPPGRAGRLNYISGGVSFQPAGVDDWAPAAVNRPLTTGDRLWVEQGGRAELHTSGFALRLGSQTAFEFLNLDDANAQIRLSEGTLLVRLRRLDQNQSFEVDTPNLAFTLLRPGEYRIDANPDNQTTTVTVRGGDGEITGASQAFTLHARQRARVTGVDSITYDVFDSPPPDGFEQWAMARDRHEDQLQALRYVPADMVGYEDLDDAGTWRPVPEYGVIWVPRAIPAGWAPYRFGHWAWIEPWGWTWVDDAAWGFAPFHYGRWAFVAGTWGWVPGPAAARPVYAPALVAWVGGSHFSLSISAGRAAGVAWFPLGPREVYMPSHHASMAYVSRVNTSNTVVNNVTVTNVYNTTVVNNTNVTNVRYVNQTVPNAVTAVPHDAFVRAQPVARAAVSVPAGELQNAQVVRSAAVAPTQASVMGHPGSLAAPHPSAAVMSRQVVAKATPPAPVVPFAQRQQELAAHPGQPVDAAGMSRLRTAQPAAVQNPFVRQASAARAMPAGQPGSNSPNPLPGERRVYTPASPASPNVNPTPPDPRVDGRRVYNPSAAPVNPNPNPASPAPRVDERRVYNPPAAPVNPNPNPVPPAPQVNERRVYNPPAAPVNPNPNLAPPAPRVDERRPMRDQTETRPLPLNQPPPAARERRVETPVVRPTPPPEHPEARPGDHKEPARADKKEEKKPEKNKDKEKEKEKDK